MVMRILSKRAPALLAWIEVLTSMGLVRLIFYLCIILVSPPVCGSKEGKSRRGDAVNRRVVFELNELAIKAIALAISWGAQNPLDAHLVFFINAAGGNAQYLLLRPLANGPFKFVGTFQAIGGKISVELRYGDLPVDPVDRFPNHLC